jgi:hypothetical protein
MFGFALVGPPRSRGVVLRESNGPAASSEDPIEGALYMFSSVPQ